MKGSVVIAKMAGIESTANTMSTIPISRITTSSGEAILTPFTTVKNFSPSQPGAVLKRLRIHLSAGLLSRSGSGPSPTRIIAARSTSAPRMPIFTPGRKDSVIPLKTSRPPGKFLVRSFIT